MSTNLYDFEEVLQSPNFETKYEETIFTKLFKDYYEHYGTAHIQIESYDEFITKGIQRIIEERQPITLSSKKDQRHVFSFGSVFIDVPRVVDEDRVVRELTPNEARLRDLTYQSSIYVDIMEKMYEGETVTKEKLHQRIVIGQIPTMVYSYHCNLRKKNLEERVQAGECRWDQGGIFIITGKERVIVAQQRPNYNFVQVIKQPTTNNTKYKFVSEIRSVAEETGYSVLVQTMISVDDRTIYASLPNIKEAIPIAIVFMALGYGTPQEITSCIDMKY